ncbi:MAG: hypothetical protein J7495_00365 [Sphingomonas sp.]|nr:hypothetical protein [Sphingomonas sp.]
MALPESAFERIARLDADLRADPSATAVLGRWCAALKLADPPTVVAVVDRGAAVAPDAATRARLGVGAAEPVVYRRVRLTCGGVTLSEAENWYVPSRLTPAMNAALTGDTPFGTVIKPLKPTRRTLAVERLWDGQGAVPQAVLRHNALVIGGDGRALAEVRETYQRGLVAP